MANTNQRLAGVTSLTIDGTAYNVTDCTYTLGKFKREPMSSLNTPYAGYKETYAPGVIKVTILDSSGFSASFFNTLTNSTVVAGAANGKQISGSGMMCSDQIEINPAEGKGELTFMGPPLVETGLTS
jgi:hypothetical protein